MLHERHFRAMNTEVGIWLWSTTPERSATIGRSLEWAEDVFARVEDELSRFRSTSALGSLNLAAGRGPQTVSPLLWTVLMSALQAADDSGGIYDPTLLRILERIGYDRSFEAIQSPCAAPAAACEPAFGSWRRVHLDRATHSVTLPVELALDFGGIAKGWTVDRVALALAPVGPVLVDAGGDLRVIGAVGSEAWPIAVQDGFEPGRDRTVVHLGQGALATSSIGGRQWHRGGRRLHHVIDPRTGTAADSDLQSVTVRAPSAEIADVAAKVVLVLGSVSGSAYLLARGLSGLLTTVQGHDIPVGDFRQEEMEPHASVHGS